VKQTRTMDYNFRWEIAKVLEHVAQLQIEATIFKGGHTAQIQQLRVSHIPDLLVGRPWMVLRIF